MPIRVNDKLPAIFIGPGNGRAVIIAGTFQKDPAGRTVSYNLFRMNGLYVKTLPCASLSVAALWRYRPVP